MKTFYLAHPALSKDKVRKWQFEMEEKHNIKFINPLFDGPKQKVKIEHKQNHDGIPTTTYDDSVYLVENDLEQIHDTDGVVAIIDGAISYGTIMEICYAHKTYNKPVYIICTNKYEKHCWLQYHSNKIFKSFEDAEEWLKNL